LNVQGYKGFSIRIIKAISRENILYLSSVA